MGDVGGDEGFEGGAGAEPGLGGPRVDRPRPDTAAERWLAEVRVEDAARHRARVASLRVQAAEAATLAGVLVDLAARGEAVQLWMVSGRRHRGHLRLVGPDACVVDLGTRQWTVVRLAAVAAVRAVRAPAVPGEAEPSTASRFATLAGALAAPGERLLVGAGTEVLGGRLEVAGTDVLTLRLDGGDLAYVPLAGVDELTLTPNRG